MIQHAMIKLWGVALLIGLSACVASHHLAEQRQLKQSCQRRCEHRLVACQMQCKDDCQTCSQQADASAAKHYARYLQDRCVEGKTRILRLQSYRDPLQCLKKSCDCAADYRICTAACSGVIHKRLQREITCCS